MLLATLIQPIAAATSSVAQHEFEDGYVYDANAAAEAEVEMGGTSRHGGGNSGKESGSETLHMNATVLGQAALVLEQLPGLRVGQSSRRAAIAESLSDFLTLTTSCKDHIQQVARGMDDADDAVDTTTAAAPKASTLAMTVQWGLETMLQLTDEFSTSLAVFQHILKRFVGSKELCETALEGYMQLVEASKDETNSVHLHVLLQSLAKLSITSDGVRDMRCLLCLMKVIHRTKDHLDAAWIVELDRLEMNPQDSASLAVAVVYGRVPQLSTCLSDDSVVQFCKRLVELILQDDWSFVTANNVNNGSFGIRGTVANRNRSRSGSSREERAKCYSEDYREDFLKRASSLRNVSQIPVSLMLFSDVLMANLFRDTAVTDELMSLLSSLSLPALQPFCMDLMTSILMHKLSANQSLAMPCCGPGILVFDKEPMHSQLWAAEPADANFQLSPASQLQILSPLCDMLYCASEVDAARASLEVLNTVIEGTGQTLRGEVWVSAVKSIGALSGEKRQGVVVDRTGSEWSSNSLMAFRTLKFIVDDFLELATFSAESRTSLLDCCSSFVASRHDINTSLTAIGLLWTIADKDSAKASISKFVLLGQDDRPEVRNAAVNTLFSCIVGQAGSLSLDDWEYCIQSLFTVYGKVLANMGDPPDNTNFDPSAKKQLRLHHSRDSGSKQWLATLILVLRGLSGVLRNNFNKLLNSIESNPWFRNAAWPTILKMSLDAASERNDGGRDSLDIRSVGVELLVGACQLSSFRAASCPLLLWRLLNASLGLVGT